MAAAVTLLDAARRGDEHAFVQLTAPHRGALHRHCYRMLGGLDDADDALQETLLRAWQAIGTFRPRAPLAAWLHRIATNVCLRMIEQRRQHAPARPRSSGASSAAWVVVDIDALIELFAEDVTLAMPPEQLRLTGPRDVGAFFATTPLDGRLARSALAPSSAHGQPALAAYAREDGDDARAYGVMVLALSGPRIVGITGFPRRPELFTRLGLPLVL